MNNIEDKKFGIGIEYETHIIESYIETKKFKDIKDRLTSRKWLGYGTDNDMSMDIFKKRQDVIINDVSVTTFVDVMDNIVYAICNNEIKDKSIDIGKEVKDESYFGIEISSTCGKYKRSEYGKTCPFTMLEYRTPFKRISEKIDKNIDGLIYAKNKVLDILNDHYVELNKETQIGIKYDFFEKKKKKICNEIFSEETPHTEKTTIIKKFAYPMIGPRRFIQGKQFVDDIKRVSKKNIIINDVLGSYHLNLTLPYNETEYENDKNEYMKNGNIEMEEKEVSEIYEQCLNDVKQKLEYNHLQELRNEYCISVKKLKKQYPELDINELYEMVTKNENVINTLSSAYVEQIKDEDILGEVNRKTEKKINEILKERLERKYELLKKTFNKKYMLEEHKKWALAIQLIEPLIISSLSHPDELSLICKDEWYAKSGFNILLYTNNNGTLTSNIKEDFNSERNYDIDIKNTEKFPLWIQKLIGDENQQYFMYDKLENTADVTFGYDFRRDSKYFEGDLPYGFEFRLLDLFDPIHLKVLLKFLFVLAEHIVSKPIMNINPSSDETVNNFFIDVIKNGYNTKLSNEYITIIKNYLHLNLEKINNDNNAFELLNEICTELWNTYCSSETIFNDTKYIKYVMDFTKDIPLLPNINKETCDLILKNCNVQNGGDNMYNKYLKYKRKYMNIKNSFVSN